MTKHPNFLISSRSKKIGGKYKVKIINRNEDYGRDCFDDLKDDMGSQGKLWNVIYFIYFLNDSILTRDTGFIFSSY